MNHGNAFAHLQVASSFSLQYGVSTPEALAQQAAKLGHTSLALTDRDGVRGAVRFVRACAQAGIRPVLGTDLSLRPSCRKLPGALRSMAAPGVLPPQLE